MQLPSLQGNLDQSGFFIYAAGDTEYFQDFGPALIRSVQVNTTHGLHLHLYNPTAEQVQYCRSQPKVSVTFESVPLDLFEPAVAQWLNVPNDIARLDKYNRTLTAMKKGRDASIQQRMQRTYFACARFIRLAQLIKPTDSMFAMDIDAVVRGPIPDLSNFSDFYIHHIEGKKARYLAGGMYFARTNAGYDFLQNYARVLMNHVNQDDLYWGLDQDLLDHLVPQYRWGQLPMECIDWTMSEKSHVWTAKGTRKELAVFVNEKQKYTA